MLLFFASSWIIIHFGKKPVSGGRPPNDNITIIIRNVIKGILFHAWDNDSVVVVDVKMKSINVEMVIVI